MLKPSAFSLEAFYTETCKGLIVDALAIIWIIEIWGIMMEKSEYRLITTMNYRTWMMSINFDKVINWIPQLKVVRCTMYIRYQWVGNTFWSKKHAPSMCIIFPGYLSVTSHISRMYLGWFLAFPLIHPCKVIQ